jgi:hypothetical protein
MKKVLMSIVAVLLAANSFAQTNSGGFSLSESTVYYGARIGMNVSTITGDGTSDMKSKVGLNLGGVLGLRISDATPLFLESGLYFTQYGAKMKDGFDDKSYITINYLEIPVLIKYGFQVTDEIAVLPYLGPTLGLGITAKGKFPDATGGYSTESGFKDNDLNRPNVGIKLGCGAEWNKLYLEAGYHFGITNILDSDDDAWHNGNLFINFGVNF